jgi:hypothetical protein
MFLRGAVCAFSRQLEVAATDQLLQLFGPSSQATNFQYTAAHLRLGGLGHEGHLKKDRGTGKGELADVIAALTCAQRLGQEAGLDTGQSPVLTITDNHMLRSFVLSGGLVSCERSSMHRHRLCSSRKHNNRAWSLQSLDEWTLAYLQLAARPRVLNIMSCFRGLQLQRSAQSTID